MWSGFGFVEAFEALSNNIKDHVVKLLADTFHCNLSHEIEFSWAVSAVKMGTVGLDPHSPHFSGYFIAEKMVHLALAEYNSCMSRLYG